MNIKDYTYDKYLDGEAPLLDAHCHLSLMDDKNRYFECLSFGLLPCKFNKEEGLGYHPWMVFEDSYLDQLKEFKNHVNETDLIGEIGLDFSPKHISTKDTQIKVFSEICKLLKNKTVSIHAVHATKEVLDILEKANDNTIILHWFAGTSDDFKRAKDMGCYFSVGPRMAQTRRGSEYIRQIPEDKMLIETDLPWEDKSITPEEHFNILNDFLIYLRENFADVTFKA